MSNEIDTDKINEKTAFSHGYDHGDYGNAYESRDWESWSEDLDEAATERGDALYWRAFRDGALLGFFSSYEISEIDSDVVDEVESLRAAHPEHAL